MPVSPRDAAVRPAMQGVPMIRRLLLFVPLILVLGGLIFLLTWDIPPPTRPVELVIPDERLPR